MLTSEMNPTFENAIRQAWEKIDLSPIAVRSSCVGEDSYDKSYAGIFSSYLHITTLQGLLQAIRNVWKSVFLNRQFIIVKKIAFLVWQL